MSHSLGSLLIVDDDEDVLHALQLLLKRHARKVHTEKNPERIPSMIRNEDYDLILLDMNFKQDVTSGREGFHWLGQILEYDPASVVVMITAYGDVDTAVRAIKEGATDFVVKPWQNERLLATLSSASRLRESRKEIGRLRHRGRQLARDLDHPYQEFIGGASPSMQRVFETIDKVAGTDANVLVLGENGTGKELVARALHRANPWLDRLPHVVLSPTAPSNYRIRREPHESYLSTIESISLALRILEPDLEGLDEVLAAFDAMIDTQIQFRRARPGPKRRRHAQTYFGVPRAIAEAWERLVLGYVEATNAGEPVQVVLVRPADGSVLDVLSRCPLDETFVARTELSRKDLEAGVSLDAVRAAVQAFLRPTDRVHGWTPRDVARLEAAGVPRPRSLRSAYRSVRGRGRGHLGEVVSMEALSPERVPVRGRAGERLGNALAIARYLHLRGQGLVHEAAPERQGSGPSLERPNV